MTSPQDLFEATRLLIALGDVTVPSDAHPDGFRLYSTGINHKFGFNDGDAPDAVIDMVQAYYRDDSRWVQKSVWNTVLMHLVQTRLLPAIGNPHVDLYLLSTSHNPIRSRTPLSKDFPHGDTWVPWIDVLSMVVITTDNHHSADN